jgi:hypothetical protein
VADDNVIAPFHYASRAAPAGYVCTECSAHGCKLWRQYQTCADSISLLCANCALKRNNLEGVTIDDSGKHRDSEALFATDNIGWLVPAVPTEDGVTYFGYTSAPQDGVDWWVALPSYPALVVTRPLAAASSDHVERKLAVEWEKVERKLAVEWENALAGSDGRRNAEIMLAEHRKRILSDPKVVLDAAQKLIKQAGASTITVWCPSGKSKVYLNHDPDDALFQAYAKAMNRKKP